LASLEAQALSPNHKKARELRKITEMGGNVEWRMEIGLARCTEMAIRRSIYRSRFTAQKGCDLQLRG
jgi:hypothetical protein